MSEDAEVRRIHERLAWALAKVDGEEDLAEFLRDRDNPPPSQENAFEDYVGIIRDMIEVSGLNSIITVAAAVALPGCKPGEEVQPDICLLEEFIAEREVEVADVDGQIERSELTYSPDRGKRWRQAAAYARRFKADEIIAAKKLRLKLLRNADAKASLEAGPKPSARAYKSVEKRLSSTPEAVQKLEKQVKALSQDLEDARKERSEEKRKRVHQVDRVSLARTHLLTYLREYAPDQVERALQGCSALQEALDSGAASVRDLTRQAREITPAPEADLPLTPDGQL
ncbi:AAA family ATPase [Leisingera caerulea]|uniref:hypothetical protein n=1 Tax=Leisingera caerulea TaxID=506591 RepID=UPI00041B5264|nr:hypothetical protein [Leisingera caerulea]